MRYLKIIFLVLFLFNFNDYYAHEKPSGSSSIFFTQGNYTNNISSSAFSIYGTLSVNSWDYYTIGLDFLSLKSDIFEYSQTGIIFSGLWNLYPFSIKASSFYISGGEVIGQRSSTNDKQILLGTELIYNYDLFFFSVGGDYSKISGYLDLDVFHTFSSISWLPSEKISVSLKPIISKTETSDYLFASNFEVNYLPLNFLSLGLRGSFGKRIFYLDEDYLTYFNQNEIQSLELNPSATIIFSKNFSIKLGYLKTEFETFDIKYFYGGIKANF